MRHFLLLLSAVLVAPSVCAQDASAPNTPTPNAPAPVVPAVTTVEAPRRARSLYADLRAFQAGDLLTVVLAERTQARRSTASQSQTSASVGGSGHSGGGVFGLDAQVAGRRDADNATAQSDLLTGTLTARVVSVDPAGNLAIEGERRLNVDGATHLLRVRGLVRPEDITTGNAILSYQIAGADVEYRQEGGSRFLRPRLLTTLGLAAVVVAAAVLGTTAVTATAAP